MPWRLIVAIIIFAVLLIFITINRDNVCNISFGFAEIENVPVFLTVFISFALGMICTLPFALRKRKKPSGFIKGKKPKSDDSAADKDTGAPDGGIHGKT